MARTSVILTVMLLLFAWSGPSLAETAQYSGLISDRTPFLEIPVRVTVDNSTVLVEMQATGGDLDPLLYLVDRNGTIVAENDDRTDGTYDSFIEFRNAAIGEYTVIATRLHVSDGDTSGTFDLDVTFNEDPADPTLDYAVSDSDLLDAGFPALEPTQEADWTILLYYGGDTNLEAGVLSDFDEFEKAGGSSDEVRIIGLLDRHPAYSTTSGDWATARLFELQADANADSLVIDSEPIADLGAVDTGEGETLAQFLVWGMRHFPAKRYALAFSSHGGAWQGIVADESSNFNILTLPELNAALTIAKAEVGIDKLDLLVNDACSMSSIEYYNIVADHFRLSIASPEIVVNPALDMQLFTEALKSDPDRSLSMLSTTLVDAYMENVVVNRLGSDQAYLNYALTDLESFGPVIAATDKFAELMLSDMQRYSTLIGAARSNTYTYSVFLRDNTLIDLGDFMQQIIALSTDAPIVQAANEVLIALESSRIYGNAAERVRDTIAYHNIYFPDDSRDFDTAYLDKSLLPAWGQMLRTYYNATNPQLWRVENSLLSYHPPLAPNVTVTQVYPETSSSAFPPAVAVEITGRRIATGAFTIDRVADDGSSQRLQEASILTQVTSDNTVNFINSWQSGVDQSIFSWRPFTLPRITDGVISTNERIVQEGSSISLEGRYREPDSDIWNDVSVLFNNAGQVQTVISDSAAGGYASVEIPVGAIFEAYRFVVTPDGQTKREAGNRYTWPEGGLTWQDEPTPSGRYRLGFLVQSFGGITGYDAVEIEVDNSGYQPEWMGYTDLSLGLNFQYPSDWSPAVDFGNLISSISPDGNTAVNVYYFNAQDNVFEIVREMQRRYSLSVLASAETLVLETDERFALQFPYSYFTQDGNSWNGYAGAFYHDTALGPTGIVFTVETRAGTGQVLPQFQFPTYVERLMLFDSAQQQAESGRAWRFEFLTNRLTYPVPQEWQQLSDGAWQVLIPPDRQDTLTHIALAPIAGDDQEAALAALIDDYAPETSSEARLYTGEHHNWLSHAYIVQRTGLDRLGRYYELDIAGRIYVATINTRLYAIRFETPADDNAAELFRTVFEPMVDGFAPPDSQQFASGGTRTTFVKAAVVSANETCAAVDRNEICYGGGDALRLLYADDIEATDVQFDAPGDTTSVDNLLALQVGVRDDGTVDPLSVAVLDLQANLPTSSSQRLKVIVFGGTTLVNDVVLQADEASEVFVNNRGDQNAFIRAVPNQTAFVEAILEPGETAIAVARTEDDAWVRVRLPDNQALTGWVRADLVASVSPEFSVATLVIGDPARPHYRAMQSFDIYVDENNSANTLSGVLIQADSGDDVVNLQINGAIFEIEPGSLFFWQAATGSLTTVSESEQSSFNLVNNRRLPGAWSSEVLTGAVRVSLIEGVLGDSTIDETIFSAGGTEIRFDGTVNALQVDVLSSEAGTVVATSLPDVQFETTATD